MSKFDKFGILLITFLTLWDLNILAQEDSITDPIYQLKSSVNLLSYPEFKIINDGNPSRDYLFTTVLKDGEFYLYISDIFGNLFFYRKMSGFVVNFKPHNSGLLTYFDYNTQGFIVLDPYYNITDTFKMVNGYVPDMHELVIQDNGDRWMIAYPNRSMDLSQVIEGGESNVSVKGLVIQKLSKDDQLLFEWNGWDHYKIKDTYMNLVGVNTLDYVHGNSINIDSDTSIIISCRNLSEISKIDTRTGEFIWRLGGKNNQFEFINDPTGFSGQHSAKKLDSGNLILFDNGINDSIQISRGVEYELDEENYTILLVKELFHDPPYFAPIKGNIQALENNRIFLYWGSLFGERISVISEYDENSDLIYEASIEIGSLFDYRVYRSKWESNIFIKEIDTLSFIQGIDGQADIKEFKLANNSEETISINNVSIKDSQFNVLDDLPIQIEAGGNYVFKISFQANENGDFDDIINFGYQTDTSLISTQLFVKGNSSGINNIAAHSSRSLIVYPNPFNDRIIIKGTPNINRALIYDLDGTLIFEKDVSNSEIELSVGNLGSGIYILKIIYSNKSYERKLLIKAP